MLAGSICKAMDNAIPANHSVYLDDRTALNSNYSNETVIYKLVFYSNKRGGRGI
jgi:hypothetical protein